MEYKLARPIQLYEHTSCCNQIMLGILSYFDSGFEIYNVVVSTSKGHASFAVSSTKDFDPTTTKPGKCYG